MKYLILFVLALPLVASIPCEVQAGPFGIFPNFHPGQKVAAVAKGAAKVAAKTPKLAARRARNRRGNSAGGTCRPV